MLTRLLLVALGGALGAVARYGVYELVKDTTGLGSALGTLCVNVVGSALIGLVAVAVVPRLSDGGGLLLMTGVLGAFTTFSTFSLDVVVLAQAGRLGTALAFVLANVLGSIGAAWAVWSLATPS